MELRALYYEGGTFVETIFQERACMWCFSVAPQARLSARVVQHLEQFQF
jgi:hypothetical protein